MIALKSAVLAIRIIGDATSAVAAMDKAERASMSFKDKVGKASVAAGAALAAIGAGAATREKRRRPTAVSRRRRNRVRRQLSKMLNS
ncbi:MAG: hypothetical protein ACLU1W_04890 [Collinsella sp.]